MSGGPVVNKAGVDPEHPCGECGMPAETCQVTEPVCCPDCHHLFAVIMPADPPPFPWLRLWGRRRETLSDDRSDW